MKYIDEYRDAEAVQQYARAIARVTSREWTLTEICGGQTHAIVRYGIDELLPSQITLLHGPGCPVCVTPVELIDKAVEVAGRPDVIFALVGFEEYLPLAVKYHVPLVVTGFEPLDILQGIYMAVREGLSFESEIVSDCVLFEGRVLVLLEAGIDLHCPRDLTRGGLATTRAASVRHRDAQSAIGATRSLDMLSGEQLPRIC